MPSHLKSLTGLRWVAALAIFLMHFAYEADFWGHARQVNALRWLTLGAPSAVSFFFILSGFVLAWSQGTRSVRRRTFYWNRFARIYPAHLVTFLAAVLLLVREGQQLSGRVALTNLTLTQSWIPNQPDFWFGFNGVSWSLSCEFFFYFTFPFLLPGLLRMSDRGLYRVLAAMTALALLMPAAAMWMADHAGWRDSYLSYILPPARLPEFVAGIVLALLVKRGSWRGPGLLVSGALCTVALLWLTRIVPDAFHFGACTLIPYLLLIPAAARADVRGTSSWMRGRIVVYLGQVSFCFYLVHELVIFAADHILRKHHNIGTAPAVITVFCVSLVLAALLHEAVEKPLARILKTIAPGRKRPAADTAKA
ncbi:acyltransferase family protein [Streptomyces sp. NPDC048416]|uniref:acyltransferase family protein n=1 Tax=Streptomyces sp. NPDC048416 TaxID=3365546 RepID=UPI003717B896